MTKVYLSRILSLGGIIAPPVLIIIIVIAGLLTPGYNQLTDTVSSLSDQASATPELMTIGFIVYGVLVIGFAYALYMRLRHGVRAHIAWYYTDTLWDMYDSGRCFPGQPRCTQYRRDTPQCGYHYFLFLFADRYVDVCEQRL